jgi:hypothetical protein
MKYTLSLLIAGFFGTPLMVIYMNHTSGKAYTAIQEQIQKEDQAFQAGMVRIEIKEEPAPKGKNFLADMHLTSK